MSKPDGDIISFDVARFKQFKIAYQECTKYKRQSFTFEGVEVLTDYAKYVIQYLEPKFKEVK